MRENIKKSTFWLYGKHSCICALSNNSRVCYELLVLDNLSTHYHDVLKLALSRNIPYKTVANFNKIVPANANHQGIALKVAPIISHNIEKIMETISTKDSSSIVLLDQITDIHNIGSIIRSAACFDVDMVILTYNHSSSENCIMAKTSSGAIDVIPVVYVTNLTSTIKYLQKFNYWSYGLDVNAETPLSATKFHNKSLIILGAEDKGLRQLTKKNCDFLVKIPISKKVNSLNVSNAAAISLYLIGQNQNNEEKK